MDIIMTQRWLVFWLSLIALCGSLTAVFATGEERDFELRGYIDPTQTTELPYRQPRFGVNAELLQYDTDTTELAQHFVWMQRAHVTWIRQFVYWNEIETEPGVYDWSKWDAMLEVLADYPDLRLVVVFMNSPVWARPEQLKAHLTVPPDDTEDFAQFVRVFAERYGHIVDTYQIWDEPNLWDAWGESLPKAIGYVAMLCEAYQAIHSADIEATVIAAGLAPTVESGPKNINEMQYLDAMYRVGAKNCMDAVAGKPFGFDLPPDDRRVQRDVMNLSRFVALREVMLKYDDGRKSLWASAWGWNALPEDWTGDDSIWEDNTEAQQIQYTLDTLQRADREWAWLGGMMLWHWQPDVPPDDPQWGFAIFDVQNRGSKLYEALVLRDRHEFARNGLYHPRTPYARYNGIWKFSDLGADIGWLEDTDSYLEFDFSGRDIALLLREGKYEAFLYPRVDREFANSTPQNNQGNSYIFLRSATLQEELNIVPVSRNLSDSEHMLSVIADKGWDRWALAGYAVSDGDLAAPYNQQISLAWFTTLIATLTVIVSGWRLRFARVLQKPRKLYNRLNDTGQFVISIITSLALMLGMLLTWGDAIPLLFRRDIDALSMGLLIVLSGGLVVLEPGLLLTIIAALLLFFMIYNRIQWGLLLTLYWMPFFLFPVELYLFAFPPAEFILLITFAAWLLKHLVSWGQSRQSRNADYPAITLYIRFQHLHPLDYVLLAWLIVGAITLLWADYSVPAFAEFRQLLLEPCLFYLILRTQPANEKTLLQIISTLLVAATTVAIIGLFLYLRCEVFQVCAAIIEAEAGTRRLASIYGSPNNVALFLGRCIPFALAFVLLIRKNFTLRLLSALSLCLMLLAVLFTQSVGAYLLGLPVGMLTVFLLIYKKRALLPIAGLLTISAGGVFLLTQVSARFASLLDFSTGTNFFRLRVWESALNIIKDHPIRGLGLDQFLYAFRGHYIRPDAIEDRDLSHPHNIVLDFWIRQGIAGLFILLLMQWFFWHSIWRAKIMFQQSPVLLAITTGTMGSMANLLVHGLVDNSVFVFDLAYVFVLLIGISVRLTNIVFDNESSDISIE